LWIKARKLRRVQVGDYTKSHICSSRRFVLKRRLRLYSRIAFWAKSAVHRFRQGRSGIGWDTRVGVRRGNPDREVRYELHT